MPQSLSVLFYHLVFSTKGRFPFLHPSIRPGLYAHIGDIIRNHGGRLIEIGGTSNHVHQLVSLSKNMAVSAAIREIKSRSSKRLRSRSQKKFAWQGGYAIFTVSPSKVGQVKEYIRNQEIHHRKATFQEELRALLRAHGVSFDERYLWD